MIKLMDLSPMDTALHNISQKSDSHSICVQSKRRDLGSNLTSATRWFYDFG